MVLGMLLLSGRVCREAEAGVKYVKPNHLYGFPHPALRRISIAVSLSLTAVCQLSVKTEESTQASALKKQSADSPVYVYVCVCAQIHGKPARQTVGWGGGKRRNCSYY